MVAIALAGWLLAPFVRADEVPLTASATSVNLRIFSARGVIQELSPDRHSVVIRHGAISNFMDAMTMPFQVRNPGLLAGLHPGDEVSFRLNVTSEASWVDQLRKTGTGTVEQDHTREVASKIPSTASFMDYALTNELGQKVCLNDFRGQALAITFFYTRCPLPEFCPRLSKNFQQAAAKLRSRPGSPTNWHFLSISFDPAFDSPALLKAYGDSYGYRPDEWSFLTGSPENIRELARISGVTYSADSGAFKHNFRTLIVDPAGRLRMIFPIGGDLSDELAAQIIKAATATNQPVLSARTP